MEFKDNLRTLRVRAELSQTELSDKIKVNQKTISSWETGRTEPSINEVVALCRVFGCTIEDLTGTKSRDVGDITMEDIYVKLGSLDMDELMNLKEFINKKLQMQVELERVMHEKARLEQELKDMQRRIDSIESDKRRW